MGQLEIQNHLIGDGQPTFFIADIAANHDGSLERAKKLIRLAKEAGADAAKFQHFKASKIVSDLGFSKIKDESTHQATWTKTVVEVYEDASVPDFWTMELKLACDELGIVFFSSPYDFESVDHLFPFVPAFKIGSGDIDWSESLEYIAQLGKPVLLGTGASTMQEVERAVEVISRFTSQIAILQCNTNYTGEESNLDFLNLRVINTFRERWPEFVIGLSDHTDGHAAVLGAVALGAKIIERHFTDDRNRRGPDHKFALNPEQWREMVNETRRLERALGSSEKFVAENEIETLIVQRRCIRADKDISPGDVIARKDISILRPALTEGLSPDKLDQVVGRTAVKRIDRGTEISFDMIK